jgi:hypothetical protein
VLLNAQPGTITKTGLRVTAGTYFVRVLNDLNFSNYHLRINADYAGNTPSTERVTGPLDGGKKFVDFISSTEDSFDVYRFSVSSTRPLHAVFLEDGGVSSLSLFKDANNDGIPQPSEQVFQTQDDSVHQILRTIDKGNYLLEVTAGQDITSGTYQLFMQTPPDAAGNALATAQNVGNVNGLVEREEFVSNDDPFDFYKFTATAAGTIGAQLVDEFGGNVDLALIRDANNNGVIDPGEILAASSKPASQDDQFTTSITPGTYFLRVSHSPHDDPSQYFLSFVTDYAGGTVATARNVGALTGTRGFDDWASGPFGGVISDTNDLYKFTLASAKKLIAKLTGSIPGQELKLILYRDKNNDGRLTNDEIIAQSNNPNSPNEQITQSLAAGTYYVRVFGINGETNYHLSLTAS